jgi:hypothetical protein
MLRTTKNTEIFEAVSETPDGITVMTFKAEVDKADPANSALDVKKESESLYRQYRDMASADRADFENQIFRMLDDVENPRPIDGSEVVDGEYEEVTEGGDGDVEA